MSVLYEAIARTFTIGIGATIMMDLWAATLRSFGVSSLNFALLGRWIGHLPRGRWIHADIGKTAAVRGELILGWIVHYCIGIAFAALLVTTFGLKWARMPTLAPALLIGIATVVAPLLILQPALGAGIAASKTPAPLFNCGKSVVTHLIYGLGLYLAALASAALIPSPR